MEEASPHREDDFNENEIITAVHSWMTFVESNGGETAVEDVLLGADSYEEQMKFLEAMFQQAKIIGDTLVLKRAQLKGGLKKRGWLRQKEEGNFLSIS